MNEAAPAPVLLMQPDPLVGPGWLAEALAQAGRATMTIRPFDGQPLPDAGAFAGVAVLGGFMGAYDEDAFPYLVDLKVMLRDAVAARIPVLGICLGAQLLADALGGRAYQAPTTECAYPPLRLTDAGMADPVVSRMRPPVLAWHHDTFDLPPGASMLARSPAYPQAFRVGSALGVQVHPEAKPDTVRAWIAHVGVDVLRDRGGDPDEVLRVIARSPGEVEAAGRAVLDAWVAELQPAAVA